MVKEDVSFLAAGLILITGMSDLLINFLALEPRKFKSKFSSFFFLKNFNMHCNLKGKGKPDFKP